MNKRTEFIIVILIATISFILGVVSSELQEVRDIGWVIAGFISGFVLGAVIIGIIISKKKKQK